MFKMCLYVKVIPRTEMHISTGQHPHSKGQSASKGPSTWRFLRADHFPARSRGSVAVQLFDVDNSNSQGHQILDFSQTYMWL